MLYSSGLPGPKDIAAAVNNPERLKAVRELAGSVRPNAIFERLSRAAGELLRAPLTLISLVEDDRDIIYGQTGIPRAMAEKGYIDAQPSFCALTITADKPVVIEDAQAVPTLRLFPSVSQLGVRAHLGIPLKLDGQPVGNCCVIDFRPRRWSPEDVAALTQLAEQALEEMRASRAV
jgi:GAF domain-containing protein